MHVSLSLLHFWFGNVENTSIFFSDHEIGDPGITKRRIQHPANHLRWNFNKRRLQHLAANYSLKKFHFRCLSEF